MLQKYLRWFSSKDRDGQLQASLAQLRHRAPVPVFWLFGKTQSGKTSLIKYLTGADEAEIGHGFEPCTRFSRRYQFPTAEAPLLTFLDTRGMDEPGYDPEKDLKEFNAQAHLVIVTVKVLDHAQEHVLASLRRIRQSHPSRPIVLVLTCLHEAYPQQQHPQPYPFSLDGSGVRSQESGARGQESRVRSQEAGSGNPRPAQVGGQNGEAAPRVAADATGKAAVPEALQRSLEEQQRRFAGLVDRVVPVDLTRSIEGFTESNYGGEQLKQVVLDVLPAAYRQTLLTLETAKGELQDLFARHVLPHILGYSSLAATAGTIWVPWLDLLILPGIQSRMIYHLARLYGQPLSTKRFLEVASTLGLGVGLRQATRELIKFIPGVGSVAGAVLAGASTLALGKAFCYYYGAVLQGHVPQAADLRRYYAEQLALAEKAWKTIRTKQSE
jgi:uncharacterized protein (DUF697 family)